jgi:hypothetical protein
MIQGTSVLIQGTLGISGNIWGTFGELKLLCRLRQCKPDLREHVRLIQGTSLTIQGILGMLQGTLGISGNIQGTFWDNELFGRLLQCNSALREHQS